MVDFNFPRVTRPAAPRRLSRTSDGDTPVIDQPIRMVSIDTPEKASYAGRPPVAQQTLNRCRDRLRDGTYDMLPDELREHLISRITPDAAERHIAAAERASAHFTTLLDRRLTRPDGRRRRAGVIATGELLDGFGRLLAYVVPWFEGGTADPLPPRDDPERRTLNLDMVASGWAAMFLIYPSIPQNADLNLLIGEAQRAWDTKAGAWAEFGDDLLLAYEYRACVKLGVKDLQDPGRAAAGAFQRICVDLRDRRVLGLHGYHEIPPSQRLWIWEDDFDQARKDLDLPA